jgi:hypothetical protein
MTTNRWLAAAAFLALPVAAPAIPFDNSSGGPTTATVGTGGDYATLSDASIAFNAVAGGINRPWTLLILNDLTEPNNVGLVNTFGTSGSLTIKPAPATTPKVTFTQTASPAGTAFFGHLVIGSNAIDQTGGPNTVPSLTNTLASNNAYVIDGSNTQGGTTRDLTFAVGETTAIASPVNNIIRIVGDTDGVIIRNTNFIFNDTAGSFAAIGLGGANISSNDLVPDNTLIENCSFVIGQGALAGVNGFGIQTTIAASGTVTAGVAIQGLSVNACEMTVRQRGIFMNGVGSATIQRNSITIANSGTGTATAGIFHFNSNSATGWTQVYNANTITASSAVNTAGTNGTFAILADSGPTSGSYVITNNAVKGPFLTNSSPVDALARGISLGSVTSTYLVEHNSVSVPDSSASGVTSARVAALIFPSALTTGNASIRNNILRMGETENLTAAISVNTTAGLTFEGNLVYAPPTGRIARLTGPNTNITSFANWQALGFDTPGTGGQSTDPFFTIPNWNSELRFAGRPIQGISGVALSTVLTDIDGNARPATDAIPGAHEPGPLAARATGWESYE